MTAEHAGATTPVRILVADDQAAVREGLATMLDLLADVEVVATATNGADALRKVAQHAPDVVLMDLHMPGMDGIEATRRIHAEHPGSRVVVLTTYADDASILAGLRAGALGYLTKEAGRAEIARAVHAAVAGQSVLDSEVARRLITAADTAPVHPPSDGPGATLPASARPDGGRRSARSAATRPAGARAGGLRADGVEPAADRAVPARRAVLPDGLTAREGEVLELIAGGLTNREIAARMYVSEATVKTHINNLFAKAALRDRAQAVRYAYEHGLHPMA